MIMRYWTMPWVARRRMRSAVIYRRLFVDGFHFCQQIGRSPVALYELQIMKSVSFPSQGYFSWDQCLPYPCCCSLSALGPRVGFVLGNSRLCAETLSLLWLLSHIWANHISRLSKSEGNLIVTSLLSYSSFHTDPCGTKSVSFPSQYSFSWGQSITCRCCGLSAYGPWSGLGCRNFVLSPVTRDILNLASIWANQISGLPKTDYLNK